MHPPLLELHHCQLTSPMSRINEIINCHHMARIYDSPLMLQVYGKLPTHVIYIYDHFHLVSCCCQYVCTCAAQICLVGYKSSSVLGADKTLVRCPTAVTFNISYLPEK